MAMKYTQDEVKEAAVELLDVLADARARRNPDGIGEVYALVRHVSRSGMTRRICFWIIDASRPDRPWLRRITHPMSMLLGQAQHVDGVKAEGCGMDMGWLVLNTAVEAAHRVLGRAYDSRDDQIQPYYI